MSKVSEVIVSSRLTDSASCLVVPKNEPGAQLRRILRGLRTNHGSV